jgi:hypothetical protein
VVIRATPAGPRGAVRRPRGQGRLRGRGHACAPGPRSHSVRRDRARRAGDGGPGRRATEVVGDECWSPAGRRPRHRRRRAWTRRGWAGDGPGPGRPRLRAEGGRRRLAVRRRRLQRARPPHPHGQVPGSGGRRRHPGPRRQPTWPTTAWCPGSPSPTRRSAPSAHRGRGQAVRPRRQGGQDRHRRGAGAYVQGNGIAGTSQLIVDQARRVVVGATFTGPGTQELLHSATVAVAGQVPLERLWHAVPSFPTVSVGLASACWRPTASEPMVRWKDSGPPPPPHRRRRRARRHRSQGRAASVVTSFVGSGLGSGVVWAKDRDPWSANHHLNRERRYRRPGPAHPARPDVSTSRWPARRPWPRSAVP